MGNDKEMDLELTHNKDGSEYTDQKSEQAEGLEGLRKRWSENLKDINIKTRQEESSLSRKDEEKKTMKNIKVLYAKQ